MVLCRLKCLAIVCYFGQLPLWRNIWPTEKTSLHVLCMPDALHFLSRQIFLFNGFDQIRKNIYFNEFIVSHVVAAVLWPPLDGYVIGIYAFKDVMGNCAQMMFSAKMQHVYKVMQTSKRI